MTRTTIMYCILNGYPVYHIPNKTKVAEIPNHNKKQETLLLVCICSAIYQREYTIANVPGDTFNTEHI